MMPHWRVKRSKRALAVLASTKTRPFAESKICCDNDRGPFVRPDDQIAQQLYAGLSEGQSAGLVQ
jgi:hypothetical protein